MTRQPIMTLMMMPEGNIITTSKNDGFHLNQTTTTKRKKWTGNRSRTRVKAIRFIDCYFTPIFD